MKLQFDPGPGACKDLVKLVADLTAPLSRWGAWEVAMELMFYALTQQEEEWQKTKARVEPYDKEFDQKLAKVMADCMYEMSQKPRDILGRAYMVFGMGEAAFGQFFTPNEVSVAMAKIAMTDLTKEMWEKPGGLRIMEPAVGAGTLLIHALNEIKEQGGESALHRTVAVCVDFDRACCMMTAIQLYWWSMMHNGVGQIWVYRGDSLRGNETWERMAVFGMNPGLSHESEPEPTPGQAPPIPVVPDVKPGQQMGLF